MKERGKMASDEERGGEEEEEEDESASELLRDRFRLCTISIAEAEGFKLYAHRYKMFCAHYILSV